jgi:hypothetical protein
MTDLVICLPAAGEMASSWPLHDRARAGLAVAGDRCERESVPGSRR